MIVYASLVKLQVHDLASVCACSATRTCGDEGE